MTETAASAKLQSCLTNWQKNSVQALSDHYVIMAMISLHSGHIYSNARIARDLKIRCLPTVDQ